MNGGNLLKKWEDLLNSADFTPVIVRTVERVHDSTWNMSPNIHDFYEMVYVKKGHVVFEISGKKVNAGPNDIIIIKPDQPHKFVVKSEMECDFIVFNFKFENKIGKKVSEVSIEDFINFVKNKESGPYINLKVGAKNDIVSLLDRIIKEKQNVDIGTDFLNYLLVLELFVLLSRAIKMEWENSIKGKSTKLKEVIQASMAYINNNYERNIQLKDIAKYVFLSPSYFAKAFKDINGKSPINYLIQVRIERSKELLADTNMKAFEIASQVGFTNQQRFNEMFKKYTKTTPLQYRKLHKKH